MKTKQFTQHQKIIGYMISRRDQQEWFFAYDFMPPRMTLDYIYCVGYEATARFAELAGRYPEMLESVAAGKYKKRRVRWDTIEEWMPKLSKDLRYMFHRAKAAPSDRPTAPEAPPAREELRTMEVKAVYKGRRHPKLNAGETYDLTMEKLKIGGPVVVLLPERTTYRNVKAFQREWKSLAHADSLGSLESRL